MQTPASSSHLHRRPPSQVGYALSKHTPPPPPCSLGPDSGSKAVLRRPWPREGLHTQRSSHERPLNVWEARRSSPLGRPSASTQTPSDTLSPISPPGPNPRRRSACQVSPQSALSLGQAWRALKAFSGPDPGAQHPDPRSGPPRGCGGAPQIWPPPPRGSHQSLGKLCVSPDGTQPQEGTRKNDLGPWRSHPPPGGHGALGGPAPRRRVVMSGPREMSGRGAGGGKGSEGPQERAGGRDVGDKQRTPGLGEAPGRHWGSSA